MIKLNIDLDQRSYPIYITTGYDNIGKAIENANLRGKMVLITDTNVDKCQANECIDALRRSNVYVEKFVIKAGEKSKNLDTIKEIYNFLVDLKLDRNATLVALGGGVVGDITGFVASTFLRGINFVQIPTTLLSQSDSSVGGKVGVDFKGHKNIIGSFYQPKLVYINVNSLKTLPKRELCSGLAEVVKHGIIKDEEFYEYIDDNAEKILNLDESVLQYIVKINCSIKGNVVEKDEKESGLRAILNFGHTIGHAIETVMGFEFLHGECVSLGMIAAFKVANYLDIIDDKSTEKVKKTLEKISLPVTLQNIDVDRVYNQMFYDKKVKGNKLQFILPRKKIGEVIQCTIDDEKVIKKAIESLNN
ncbi:3-dehydroquinate synthase [Herbivorax sp. ANBcel31]|uniref:3-dehydroquinate synthase n=1 Tax=Herbivorax sp. ANBcel31 TaxID=3069754 RepID=UPI0027B1D4A7|nr:3-dehydroquinate synthase [Herbivorax sp. ANBcel31]MDQ2086161.1 3-dehydroquinate synthase [Herbivorax sp. ANBcel31]